MDYWIVLVIQMLVFICVLLIFSVYYNEEPSNDDDNERVIPDVEVQETAEKPTASVVVEETAEFGPHLKLSRGEELYKFQKEVAMVKEKKILCSLDLFLDLFVGCCRIQG